MYLPRLSFLFVLLCGSLSLAAQRYQGVSLRNGKTKQYKASKHWTHEVQLALKFPNARGVSRAPWLSKTNLSDYTAYPSGANLAYYVSPGDKYAFGIELYYDANVRAVMGRDHMIYSERKDMVSSLLQFRYYWYKPGDPGSEDFWMYSGAGIGVGNTQLVSRGNYGFYPHDEDFLDWKYKNTLQYQAVVLGMIGGLADFRFVGELGYGTLFIVKAGVNYRFPSK